MANGRQPAIAVATENRHPRRNSISVSERESGRCGRRRRRAREKGWRRGGRERDVSPRGVLSRNVVRNGVRGALATRHAVRAREGVTFAKAKRNESSSSSSSSTRTSLCSHSCSVVVRANLPNILLSSGTSFCSSASLQFYSITKHAKHARTTCNHREKDSTTTITTIPFTRRRFTRRRRVALNARSFSSKGLIVKNVLVYVCALAARFSRAQKSSFCNGDDDVKCPTSNEFQTLSPITQPSPIEEMEWLARYDYANKDDHTKKTERVIAKIIEWSNIPIEGQREDVRGRDGGF